MVRSIVLACSSSSALDSVIYDMQVAAKKGGGEKISAANNNPFPGKNGTHGYFIPFLLCAKSGFLFPLLLSGRFVLFFSAFYMGKKGSSFLVRQAFFCRIAPEDRMEWISFPFAFSFFRWESLSEGRKNSGPGYSKPRIFMGEGESQKEILVVYRAKDRVAILI